VRPSRNRLLAACLFAALLAPAFAAPTAGFDPGRIANTANDPAWNLENSTAFQTKLNEVTPFACPVNCTITQSDDVKISIEGPSRLSGTFSEVFRIRVTGPPYFGSNYTTISAVIKGNASDVVIQPDATAERTGAMAYTKDVNGSSTMNLTLLPSNRSGNVTLHVIAYVGDGNRTHHNDSELYAIASHPIQMRAQRLVPLNYTVANRANVSVTSLNVSFFAKGPNDLEYFGVGNSTIAAIAANGQGEAGVAWDATWADPSVYSIKVVIDPLHQHPDALEENNVDFFFVNLGPPPVDHRGEAIGTAFFWGTLIVFGLVAAALYIYNKRYE
jgi:hypothetical protein